MLPVVPRQKIHAVAKHRHHRNPVPPPTPHRQLEGQTVQIKSVAYLESIGPASAAASANEVLSTQIST